MQGLDIYDSKEVRDKQIARIIGKVQFFDSFHPSVSLHASNYDYSVPLLYCNILFFLLQITTIAAAVYLRMAGRPPVLPSNQLSYTENFLYMLDSLYVLWYFYV
jgi:citrate synthase